MYQFVRRANVLPEYYCQCSNLLDKAYLLPCGHTVCHMCEEYCSSCRKQSGGRTRDYFVSSLINSQQVVCQGEGCAWNGPLDQYEFHRGNCNPVPVEDFCKSLLDSIELTMGEDCTFGGRMTVCPN
jgi:hypothetical protein